MFLKKGCYFKPSLILKVRFSERSVCLLRWAINFHSSWGGERKGVWCFKTPPSSRSPNGQVLSLCIYAFSFLFFFLSPTSPSDILLGNPSPPPGPLRLPAGWRMASAVDEQSQLRHLVALLLSLSERLDVYVETLLFYASCIVLLFFVWCSHKKRANSNFVKQIQFIHVVVAGEVTANHKGPAFLNFSAGCFWNLHLNSLLSIWKKHHT